METPTNCDQNCGSEDGGHRLKGEASLPGYRNYLENNCQTNPKIFIELSSICNFHCFYCESPNHTRKSQIDDETFYSALDQACRMTTHPIQFHCDGEPTVHAKFHDYAKAVNDRGLGVILATNGSNLKEKFLELRMDIAIHLSTSRAEFARRSPLGFDKYLAGLKAYLRAWLTTETKQNLDYYIYLTAADRSSDPEMLRIREFANDFLADSGFERGVAETAAPNSAWYVRQKADGYRFRLSARHISSGGVYPDIEQKKPVTLPRNFGFCDSPWKRLVILSDGSLQACCLDLKGSLAYTEPAEIKSRSLQDLWNADPRIARMRADALRGEMNHPTCQKCLDRLPSREFYIPTNHGSGRKDLTGSQFLMWRRERSDDAPAGDEKALRKALNKQLSELSEFARLALQARLQEKWDALPFETRRALKQEMK